MSSRAAVLLVEHDASVRTTVSAALTLVGFRVAGLELLSFIRASADLAHLPAVIFTATELSRTEELVARTHGARVFYKPQGSAELVDHLATLLPAAAADA
jgi:hypothetical protein